jgi:hypothetical protein
MRGRGRGPPCGRRRARGPVQVRRAAQAWTRVSQAPGWATSVHPPLPAGRPPPPAPPQHVAPPARGPARGGPAARVGLVRGAQGERRPRWCGGAVQAWPPAPLPLPDPSCSNPSPTPLPPPAPIPTCQARRGRAQLPQPCAQPAHPDLLRLLLGVRRNLRARGPVKHHAARRVAGGAAVGAERDRLPRRRRLHRGGRRQGARAGNGRAARAERPGAPSPRPWRLPQGPDAAGGTPLSQQALQPRPPFPLRPPPPSPPPPQPPHPSAGV